LLAAVLLAASAGIAVSCRPEVAPPPIAPMPREAPPIAPRPDPIPPNAAAQIEAIAHAQLAAATIESPGSAAARSNTQCCGAAIDGKQLPPQNGSAVPAGIPPRHDAGVDSLTSLPPVPDAGSMLRDAGTPMHLEHR